MRSEVSGPIEAPTLLPRRARITLSLLTAVAAGAASISPAAAEAMHTGTTYTRGIERDESRSQTYDPGNSALRIRPPAAGYAPATVISAADGTEFNPFDKTVLFPFISKTTTADGDTLVRYAGAISLLSGCTTDKDGNTIYKRGSCTYDVTFADPQVRITKSGELTLIATTLTRNSDGNYVGPAPTYYPLRPEHVESTVSGSGAQTVTTVADAQTRTDTGVVRSIDFSVDGTLPEVGTRNADLNPVKIHPYDTRLRYQLSRVMQSDTTADKYSVRYASTGGYIEPNEKFTSSPSFRMHGQDVPVPEGVRFALTAQVPGLSVDPTTGVVTIISPISGLAHARVVITYPDGSQDFADVEEYVLAPPPSGSAPQPTPLSSAWSGIAGVIIATAIIFRLAYANPVLARLLPPPLLPSLSSTR